VARKVIDFNSYEFLGHIGGAGGFCGPEGNKCFKSGGAMEVVTSTIMVTALNRAG